MIWDTLSQFCPSLHPAVLLTQRPLREHLASYPKEVRPLSEIGSRLFIMAELRIQRSSGILVILRGLFELA